MGESTSLSEVRTKAYIPSPFDKPEFINLVRMHRNDCIKKGRFTVLTIPDAEALQCKGDFYLLLQKNNVLTKQWYLTLLINGLLSPTEFNGILLERRLFVPSISYLDELAKSFNASVDIV